MTASGVDEADRQFADWMRHNLYAAAEHFGATVADEPIHGWLLLTISAPVQRAHEELWLRVRSEHIQHAHGHWWTGQRDANVISGITKPTVFDSTEWDIPDVRRQRADLMTRMVGEPVSATDALRDDVALPTAWWDELRSSLDRLASTPTDRAPANPDALTDRARATLGTNAVLPVGQWETAHGDLHWNNLLRPFALLDWEFWGRKPAGTDPATLYCYSLLAPRTARTVWDVFADILDTDHGRAALLHVAARLLRRTTHMGDHPDLEQPIRRLVAQLI